MSFGSIPSLLAHHRVTYRTFWGDHSVRDIEAALAEDPERLPSVVLCVIDDDAPLTRFADHPRVTFYRTSLRRSHQSSNERVFPFCFEPVPPMPPLPRSGKPRVAFCGFFTSHPDRVACLYELQTDPRVHTEFVLRSQFWGGAPHDPQLIASFEENMESCEFNVCVRGRGNFSMRFYQTLSAGRIPIVLADTPLPSVVGVEWSSVCVVASSPKTVASEVLRFWETHDVEEVQRRCREVYATYLSEAAVGNSIVAHALRQK